MQSYFWYIFWAAIGGVIVFFSLIMEQLDERKWYKSVSHLRRLKWIRCCGEYMLLVGIFIEIAVSVVLAKDEWANNPANRPIESLRLNVYLVLEGTNFIDTEMETAALGSPFYADILGKDDIFGNGRGGVALQRATFAWSPGRNLRKFSIIYNWPGVDTPDDEIFGHKYPGETITTREFDKLLRGVYLRLPTVGDGLKIDSGTCVLSINGGALERRFSVPVGSDSSNLMLLKLESNN